MGVIAPCRFSCGWTSATCNIVALQTDKFVIGVHTTVPWLFRWNQVPFPGSPCPDPQSGIIWYRKWDPVGLAWGAWAKVKGSTTSCTSAGSAVVRCTGTTTFNMAANTNYARSLFWCERGVYQVLIDHACTTGGILGSRARRKRVIVV